MPINLSVLVKLFDYVMFQPFSVENNCILCLYCLKIIIKFTLYIKNWIETKYVGFYKVSFVAKVLGWHENFW